MQPPPVAVKPCVSGTCWVNVTVATAWVEPWDPRPADAPALGSPADPAAWIADMTIDQKQWLVGRLETQVLYGVPVIVTGHWQNWVHVAVPSQLTAHPAAGSCRPLTVRACRLCASPLATSWSD